MFLCAAHVFVLGCCACQMSWCSFMVLWLLREPAEWPHLMDGSSSGLAEFWWWAMGLLGVILISGQSSGLLPLDNLFGEGLAIYRQTVLGDPHLFLYVFVFLNCVPSFHRPERFQFGMLLLSWHGRRILSGRPGSISF